MTRRNPSSFRDPAGFVFSKNKQILRQINKEAQADFDFLNNSGLYKKLVTDKLLVGYEELPVALNRFSDAAYKIIKPDRIDFISYPYEWCFGQLKEAALITITIQKKALEYGMTLKDASAFNIQFVGPLPVFIDTLSFTVYQPDSPWEAYRQFCEHFLSPLLLMVRSDVRLNQLLRIYPSGIPLDLASKLLPRSSYFQFGALAHVHLHSRGQQMFSEPKIASATKRKISKRQLTSLIDNLQGNISRLTIKKTVTRWSDYYDKTNYSETSFLAKEKIVSDFISLKKPKVVWDIGSNTGFFSHLAAKKTQYVVSMEQDPAAVEANYQHCLENNISNCHPLLIDILNPSSFMGFANRELMSLPARGPADCVMALALIHHLAISHNLPLSYIAEFLSEISRCLIIEFVPKSDSQVKRLLSSRSDIFTDYSESQFESQFGVFFRLLQKKMVSGSGRIIYLLESKHHKK